MCDEETSVCQNRGTCVDLQRCDCPESFTGKHSPGDVTLRGDDVMLRCDDVTLRCDDVSDAVICAGTFCEKRVCLKKGGCQDDAEGSAPSLTSQFYLLTLSLFCCAL